MSLVIMAAPHTKPGSLQFPHAAQALQVVRRRRPFNGGNRLPTETTLVYSTSACRKPPRSPQPHDFADPCSCGKPPDACQSICGIWLNR